MKKDIGKFNPRRSLSFQAAVILAILTILGAVGWILTDRSYKSFTAVECPMKGTIPYTVEMVRGAVVKIEVEGIGSGSGVFIRPNLILTAGHIIDMSEMSGYYHWLDITGDEEYDSNDSPVEFIITCDDGTKLISTEYYRESNNIDVGFLVVDSNGLDIPVMKFSNNVIVGETVFTIGSPLGSLFNSVTSGIISALDRTEYTLWSSLLIQTDTSINPGNSGGPLFNIDGEIVGIVVGGYNYSDGLGLCVHSKVIYWSLAKYDAIRGLERVVGE